MLSIINQQRGTEILLCWLILQTSNHRISARVFQSKSVVSRRSHEVLAIVGVIRYTSDTPHDRYERHATLEYEQDGLDEHRTVGHQPTCPLRTLVRLITNS